MIQTHIKPFANGPIRATTLRFLCAVTRDAGQFRGRWRLIHWLHHHITEASLPESWHRIRRAGWMKLDPAEFVDRHLFIQGSYEAEVARMIRAQLECGATFVDVGANIGYFTLLAASRVGPGGEVHAIEPAPAAFKKLHLHVRANRLRNVILHPVACIDSARTVTLQVHVEGNAGMSSLRVLGDASHSHVEVPGETLDNLLSQTKHVDLVKLDIEGAELLALRGMQKTLRKHQPILILEMTDSFLRQLGGSLQELQAFLNEMGYEPQHGDTPRADQLSQEQQTLLWRPTRRPLHLRPRLKLDPAHQV